MAAAENTSALLHKQTGKNDTLIHPQRLDKLIYDRSVLGRMWGSSLFSSSLHSSQFLILVKIVTHQLLKTLHKLKFSYWGCLTDRSIVKFYRQETWFNQKTRHLNGNSDCEACTLNFTIPRKRKIYALYLIRDFKKYIVKSLLNFHMERLMSCHTVKQQVLP